jgi:hypothetical protein
MCVLSSIFRGALVRCVTLDELNANLKDVVALLNHDGAPQPKSHFVEWQTVGVACMSGMPALKSPKVISRL